MNHGKRKIIILTLKSDCRDTYKYVKATAVVPNTEAHSAAVNNTSKKVIFKNCAPFTHSVSVINNPQVDDAQDIDIVMPMYNLIEYSDVYLKTWGSLWHYYNDELIFLLMKITAFHSKLNSK